MQSKINEIRKKIEEEGFRFEVGKFGDGHRYKISFQGPSGENQWLCKNYDELESAFVDAFKTRELKFRQSAPLLKTIMDIEGQISHVRLIHIANNFNNDFECRFEFLDGPFLGRTVFRIFSESEMQAMGITIKEKKSPSSGVSE